MKKNIILGLLLILCAGCTNYQNSDKIKDLEEKITTLEKEIRENDLKEKEFIFQKKKVCAEIDISEDIKKNWGIFSKDFSIDEIFYSQSRNSCIGIITLYLENGNDIWGYDILQKKWFLNKLVNKDGNCSYNGEVDKICLKNVGTFNDTLELVKK